MDKDFHYYGTYVAVRYAGYSTVEAQTIAHAAQYVDDSTHSRLINMGDLVLTSLLFQQLIPKKSLDGLQ